MKKGLRIMLGLAVIIVLSSMMIPAVSAHPCDPIYVETFHYSWGSGWEGSYRCYRYCSNFWDGIYWFDWDNGDLCCCYHEAFDKGGPQE